MNVMQNNKKGSELSRIRYLRSDVTSQMSEIGHHAPPQTSNLGCAISDVLSQFTLPKIGHDLRSQMSGMRFLRWDVRDLTSQMGHDVRDWTSETFMFYSASAPPQNKDTILANSVCYGEDLGQLKLFESSS